MKPLRRFLQIGSIAVLALLVAFFVARRIVASHVRPRSATATCTHLFGAPSERTGLDATQCAPSCACDGQSEWTPRAWSEADLSALTTWTLLNAPAALASDPYDVPPPASSPNSVCAVVVADASARTYRLQTFESARAAQQAGAIVTHHDACGVCSTLTDLAVYARNNDLAAPVRQCGLRNLGDLQGTTECIEALGFTHPCAQIWGYNTRNTSRVCLATCMLLLGEPYNTEDGQLNACLQCDEDLSGPVFKAIAGRTRRNTGVPNAICRPCDQVVRIDHDYR